MSTTPVSSVGQVHLSTTPVNSVGQVLLSTTPVSSVGQVHLSTTPVSSVGQVRVSNTVCLVRIGTLVQRGHLSMTGALVNHGQFSIYRKIVFEKHAPRFAQTKRCHGIAPVTGSGALLVGISLRRPGPVIAQQKQDCLWGSAVWRPGPVMAQQKQDCLWGSACGVRVQ